MSEINSYDTIVKAQQGDKDALDLMTVNNIALVKNIASKFINRGVEFEDLVQIGCLGLVRAIQKFDTSFEVRFSTYAVPMIMGEIKRFLRDTGTVKVSRGLKELAFKAIKTGEALKISLGREATVEEIAQALQTETEELVFALDAVKMPVSLDETLYDADSKTTLLDSLEDKGREMETIVDRIMLKQIIGSLQGRDRQIIFLRYFQDKTQREVATSLNISQVQVSRLENKILKTLKEKIC